MRKGVIALLGIFLIVIGGGFVFGQTSSEYATEIQNAFSCLDGSIDSTPSLSLEEAVFASLSGSTDSKIEQTFMDQKSTSSECWPSSGCDVKSTAQVVFAKNEMSEDVDASLDWIESQSGAIQSLTWFLQISIDGNHAGECAVEYGSSDSIVTVDDELKLSGDAGSCLTRANSNYWLQIGNGCVDESFEISCNSSFKTNLLYQDSSGGTIFVSSTTHSASQGAWTVEEISARCFRNGGNCDYEASLWATTVLSSTGRDTSMYAPYLRALAGENSRYFPSTFLMFALGETSMSDEFYQDVLNKKKTGGIWDIIGSPHSDFYNTALAILALGSGSGGADSPHVEGGIRDLFDEQDPSGCFNNNHLSDTAFLMYATGWDRSDVPTVCTSIGERTSAEAPTCCSGAELPVEEGFYGFCSECGDETCQPWEDATNCPLDCENSISVDSCFDGFWYAGDPIESINTSDQAGYCQLADSGDWPDGCCIDGFECNGEGGESICQIKPGTVPDIVLENECSGGYWYDKDGEGVDTGEEKGYCHLERDEDNWPDGCCREGYECVGEGNESICEKVNGGNSGGGSGSGQTDCKLAGLFCVADGFECVWNGGVVDRDLRCGNQIEACCSVDVFDESCFDQGGLVCAFDEECTGSVTVASDGTCCSDSCIPIEGGGGTTGGTTPECSNNGECFPDEECVGGSCVASGKDSGGGSFWTWVIILIILIGLAVAGIIYRDRLRVWWFKMRGKAKTTKVKRGPPGAPVPLTKRAPPRFGPPRRMVRRLPMGVHARSAALARRPKTKKDAEKEKEMEETLKKLREMSK